MIQHLTCVFISLKTYDRLLNTISNIQRFSPVSINSTSGTVIYDAYETFKPFPSGENEAIGYQFSRLDQIVGKYADEGEVKKLIELFELNTASSGKKSVLNLFESAWDAYKAPISSQDTPIITSLIPMRESIEMAVTELLKKRPTQEPAKNDCEKIFSICNQLKKDAISHETIQSWATQWSELKDKLSAAKNAEMNRVEWGRLIYLATVLLKSILLGLDPEKIKRSK